MTLFATADWLTLIKAIAPGQFAFQPSISARGRGCCVGLGARGIVRVLPFSTCASIAPFCWENTYGSAPLEFMQARPSIV
jgi:hypothetical protein